MPTFSNSVLDNHAPENIIWIQTSFLGDIIITTGAMALAQKVFPTVKQYLITTAVGQAALQGENLLEKIIVFDKKSSTAISAMNAVKAALRELDRSTTVNLQVHRSFRSSLLSRFLGFQTITYRQASFAWLAQHQVERISPLHEAARIALLLEPLGVAREDIHSAKPYLTKPKTLRTSGKKRFGIAPGSVWGTKRWPKEKFAELAAALLDSEPDSEVIILGSEAEKEQADYIDGKLSTPRLINLAGKTTLLELKQHIASLDLIVANDSSPIHFASAYDIPTVAIFGATVPELGFGPLAEKSTVAEIELECRPCSDHGPQQCPLGHFRCMLDLPVETVLEKCRALI